MIPIRYLWKDFQILMEWLFKEINGDIISLFRTTTRKYTYNHFLTTLISTFRSVLTSPTYIFYWIVVFFVFSFALDFNIFWKTILGILMILSYFNKLWAGGKPLKQYKEDYYKSD